MKRSIRGLGIGLMTMAALTLTIGATVLPAAAKTAKPPKLTVAPKSKLSNGTTVEVSGKNFTPGDQVYIVQCMAGDTNTSGTGCNLNNVVAAPTITTGGDLTATKFTVTTGTIGTDGYNGGVCGTTKANAKDCDISVGNASATDSATEVISFSIPKT
jgi:hypothetical protein